MVSSFGLVNDLALDVRSDVARGQCGTAFLASKALTCLYMVPMVIRSALFRVGQFNAPGTWSKACSSSLRASMTVSNWSSWCSASEAGSVCTGMADYRYPTAPEMGRDAAGVIWM
ncbi:MAG: hypothetical protein R3E56_08265 [Burkholderiaceae bacterium]